MFFGLMNSPPRFQRMMDERFKEAIATGKVRIYVDNFIIFSETLEEHKYLMRMVLQLAREAGLMFKPQKCEFEKDQMEYLGVIIELGKVEMDAKKVNQVKDWPVPHRKKDLQSFIGLANYYHWFVKTVSQISQHLHDLKKKGVEWKWEEKHQKAFDRLMDMMSMALVLRLPDLEKQYVVTTDASDYMVSAILMQEHKGVLHPLGYHS
jgi:hypothetical protein